MEFDTNAIAEFCQKHHITRMRSYANPHRTAAQSVKAPEFLVDFEPGHTPGYFDMFGGPGLLGMEEELALLLGTEEAYLQSSTGLSPYWRQKDLEGTLSKGEPLYQVTKNT